MIESTTMAMIVTSVVHRIPARDLNERVVLRSSHGSRITTTIPMVGTTIAASISTHGAFALSTSQGMWLFEKSTGTTFSNPNSDKKYHAGYGTNVAFVGSAFSSRNGGAT